MIFFVVSFLFYLEKFRTHGHEYAMLARTRDESARALTLTILVLVFDDLRAARLVRIHRPQLDGASNGYADDYFVHLIGERVDAKRSNPLLLLFGDESVEYFETHGVHN